MSKHFQLKGGDSKVVSACEEQIRNDPYNADHIAQLESSVAEQVEKQLYSFDSNIALLKLYQFNPDQLKEDVVEKILAKVSLRFQPAVPRVHISFRLPRVSCNFQAPTFSCICVAHRSGYRRRKQLNI
jgi:hypothetical protein